ncbi:MAG: ATP-binding cassette domain-containing protein, partial [Nocardioidaceae bacterium]
MTTDKSNEPEVMGDDLASATDSGDAERHGTPASNAPELPPPGSVIIEVTDLGKAYGSIIALREVTTSVKAGEVTCVLGDNGAGKSTFIKILAGAHEHTSGKFVVDGISRQMNSPRAALALGIATVFQDLAL